MRTNKRAIDLKKGDFIRMDGHPGFVQLLSDAQEWKPGFCIYHVQTTEGASQVEAPEDQIITAYSSDEASQ